MVKVSGFFMACEDIAYGPWHTVSGGSRLKRDATRFHHYQ